MADMWTVLFVVMMMSVATVSVSTLVWGTSGILRYIARIRDRSFVLSPYTSSDVAIVIAAHNEELVIANTIRSASNLVRPHQIFVASDGSKDSTVEIAERMGATVFDLQPNRGKAAAIEAALEQGDLANRYAVVMLLDADTHVDRKYLRSGLRQFKDPKVVAVAGRATTLLDPPPEHFVGRLLTSYRERLYVLMQYLHKYGQAAAATNAVAIVPGFASLYRSDILKHIDIAAPGLAIEDFNMTFEVHRKKLGRIAFEPMSAIAYTQDPDNPGEYIRQVRRWALGFWQTVRRHGPHIGLFWASLGVAIVEMLIGCVMLLLVLPTLLVSTVAWIAVTLWPDATLLTPIYETIPPLILLAGFLLPDYALTLLAALMTRKMPTAVMFFFPFVRVLDAWLNLQSLVKAWGRSSDGRWVSPSRRPANLSGTTGIHQGDETRA